MIYIGNFFLVTNQEEAQENDRRHGEFTMIIEADTDQAAIQKFRERICYYRETSDLFQGDCSVYFVQLMEFDTLPSSEALMLNYKSYAGDPIMPFIGCSIPNEKTDGCRIHTWNENIPKSDGTDEQLFIQFKSEAKKD